MAFRHNLSVACAILILCLIISKIFYNILFHPLNKFPGPWHASASRLWYTMKVFGGNHKHAIKKLHDEFGPVVRIAPSELSYIDSRAWLDIYGKSAHENGPAALEKESEFFAPAFNNSDSLVDASSHQFKPQKRNANRAFSHASLLRRGPLMSHFIDRGIDGIRSHVASAFSKRVDMHSWVGNMVIDIHTQLTMSRNFAAVNRGPSLHPIVSGMHSAVTTIQYCTQLQYLPKILTSIPKVIPSRDIFTVLGSIPPLGPALEARLLEDEKLINREDFVAHMKEDSESDVSEIGTVRKNALIFILSAVETIPGFVCSVLFYLLQKPEYFQKAQEELQFNFTTIDQITIGSAQRLVFLRAVMREALRVSPPAVGTLPRRVPRGGSIICGEYVPAGTTVGIHNWSATHSERFWTVPNQFRPERWLGDGEFSKDDRESFHPFGHGPRTCVARHLVLLESTLVVAKLIFAFNMSLDPADCGKWPDHKGHFVPTRDSLHISIG